MAAPAGPGAGRAQRRPLAPAAATAPAGQGAGRTQRHLLARYPLRRAGPPRAASAGGEPPLPEQPLAADNPILEVERQEERALAYTGITAMLGTAGLALAVAPARAVEFVWAACPSLIVQGLARTFGSFLLLAAVCRWELTKALPRPVHAAQQQAAACCWVDSSMVLRPLLSTLRCVQLLPEGGGGARPPQKRDVPAPEPGPLLVGPGNNRGAVVGAAAAHAAGPRVSAPPQAGTPMRAADGQQLLLGRSCRAARCCTLPHPPHRPPPRRRSVCTALLGAASAHAALTYQETSDQGLNPLYLLKQFLKSLGNLSEPACILHAEIACSWGSGRPGQGCPAVHARGSLPPLPVLSMETGHRGREHAAGIETPCLLCPVPAGSYANDANTSIYALYAYGLSAKATVAASAAILAHGKLRVMQAGPWGCLGVPGTHAWVGRCSPAAATAVPGCLLQKQQQRQWGLC